MIADWKVTNGSTGVGSWIARRARMAPADVALVEGTRRVRYDELHELVMRTAGRLRAHGVGRGDRVAFSGPNSIDFVVAMFATGALGAIFVPLNTRLAPPEVVDILDLAEPVVLWWNQSTPAPTPSTNGSDLTVLHGPGGRHDDCSASDEPLAACVRVDLDDPFLLQFTSGTTGRPKGVVLTHANVTWNVVNLLLDVDLSRTEVSLVTAPLFHTAALNQVLLPTLLKGGTAVLEASFDPERALALIEEHSVTLLFGVTTMYQALARADGWRARDLASLRTALSGGAPIPRALLETWLDRGLRIIQGYGLTEASPGVSTLRDAEAVDHLGTAGTPCVFTEVRVVDADGRDVPEGVPGEVLVRGLNVTAGYWHDAARTEEAFDGDWLRTGDLATKDADGYLSIVGRLKDMIVSGGENIYPAEVEDAIHGHPAVAQVAVVGVPDERWGEVGCAVVVLKPGTTLTHGELREHLAGRLARYKIPASLAVVEALPTTSSGKIVKSEVSVLVGAAEGVEEA